MTAGLDAGGDEERPVGTRDASSRRLRDESTDGSPRRLVPDGGEEESSDETADEESDDADEADEEEATDDEVEDAEESAPDDGDDEGDEEEESAPDDGDEEEDEEEVSAHVEDAEDVYEGDDASGVLHLDLDGLFLDLLGLEVNLNPVTLDVSARPGENNLLGNLLSAVTGLLDGPAALSSLLEKPKEWLGSAKETLSGWLEKPKEWLGKPKEWLGKLVRKPKELLTRIVTKPKRLLSRGDGESEEEGADEDGEESEEEEGADEDGEESESENGTDDDSGEPDEEDEQSGDGEDGRLSGATDRLTDTASDIAPSLPIERVVATVVRSALQELIEQTGTEESDAEDADAGTEASS